MYHIIVMYSYVSLSILGITRETVMELAVSIGIQVVEKRLSLAEFYTADAVFTTGTMGELTPVMEIDGRRIQPQEQQQHPQQRHGADSTSQTDASTAVFSRIAEEYQRMAQQLQHNDCCVQVPFPSLAS